MVFRKKYEKAIDNETTPEELEAPKPMTELRVEHTEEELLSYGLTKVLEELRALRSVELAIFEVLKQIKEME